MVSKCALSQCYTDSEGTLVTVTTASVELANSSLGFISHPKEYYDRKPANYILLFCHRDIFCYSTNLDNIKDIMCVACVFVLSIYLSLLFNRHYQ